MSSHDVIPDFYMEVTSNKFKSSPNLVYQQSYLHESWDTQRVYRLHPFNSGIYLLYDLHKNPHYQLPISKRVEFNSEAKEKNIPVIDITKDTFMKPLEIYHFSESSEIYVKAILPLVSALNFDDIIKLLETKSSNKRGNIAHNVGWHTLNFQFQGQVHIPSHSDVNEFDKKHFRLLTNCLKSILKDVSIEPKPFHTNSQRRNEFANHLTQLNEESELINKRQYVDDNVFESMTYAFTYLNNPDSILNPHIDALNCTQPGYNCVLGLYFNLEHPLKKSCPIRVILLGYSRKSINDFYIRLNKRELFKRHLLMYYDCLEDRKNLCLSHAIPMEVFLSQRRDKIIHTLPFVDKCAFYSIFVSCIHDLIEANKAITLHQVIELILPIGWITTGSNYYKVIKNWEKNGLPKSSNLTVEVIKALVAIGGSISSGSGPRMQPYANKKITSTDIKTSLQCLKETIVLANGINAPSIDEVIKKLSSNIKFVGFIGAQHLISVLTLVRIIHNPRFVRDTVILPNTTTEKKIKKFYALSHKLINVLYKEISDLKFNGCMRFVENLSCEFFRDIKSPMSSWDVNTYRESISKRVKGTIRFPDTFYCSQSLFMEKDNVISRYRYSTDGNTQCKEVKVIETTQLLALNIHFYKVREKEVWFTNKILNIYASSHGTVTANTTSHGSIKRKRSWLETIADNNISDTDDQYHESQLNILRMLNETDDSRLLTKFHYDNNWFEGQSVTFNSIQTLLSIIGCVPKRKGRKKRKSSVKITSHSDSNGVSYTASVKGNNRVLYLPSNHPNIFLQGFLNWFPNVIGGTNSYHLCAHYVTKDMARKALIIKGFVGNEKNNIYTCGLLSSVLKSSKCNYIAIFEKYNTSFHQFFGLISKHENKIDLLVPIDLDNELRLPWQVFKIK